jgi:hypothetical protein
MASAIMGSWEFESSLILKMRITDSTHGTHSHYAWSFCQWLLPLRAGTNPDVAYFEHGALTFARGTLYPSRVSTNDDDEDAHLSDGDKLVRHHQIHDFVSNAFMKIGLITSAAAPHLPMMVCRETLKTFCCPTK